MGTCRKVMLFSPSNTPLGKVCAISNDIDIVPMIPEMLDIFLEDINKLLVEALCKDLLDSSEAANMIMDAQIVNNEYHLILPDRFNCPHHGFASTS